MPTTARNTPKAKSSTPHHATKPGDPDFFLGAAAAAMTCTAHVATLLLLNACIDAAPGVAVVATSAFPESMENTPSSLEYVWPSGVVFDCWTNVTPI
jgi:hypothetical protein